MEVGALLREALASRYEIEHVLGRGGMAIVYRARDLKHERLVAIKVLRPEIASSLGGERFLREIQIEARLQHPHILPLYDSGKADGLLYYVMPYVEGETLRQRLDREGQLPIDDAVALAEDVAEALSYAHSHGVVHRDVKPENILLTGGHAVVADFGIARAVSVAGGRSLTSAGIAIGTPAYMSPEQGNGMEADARSDIYSLGCVLYEMLAGEPPFTGPTAQAIIARHVSERPPSLRIVRPSIPREVERTIERALAKVPADRFSTVLRFAESLETAAVARVGGHESSGPSGLWAFAGAVVLAVGVVLAVITKLAESLDTARFVVGAIDPRIATDSIQRKQWMYAMEGALRQVPDVSLTDTPLVIDRVMREGGEPSTLSGWLDLAKGLGAGRMVLVAFEDRGLDSLLVHASIYDVGRGRSTRTITHVVARADPDVRAQAARIIERLRNLPLGTLTTDPTSYEAQRAFVSARIALAGWDLDRAEAYFDEAVRLDHAHAEAHLWLAQIRAWRGESSARWIGSARLAAASGGALGDYLPLARALVHMGDGRYPQACEVYDSLVRARPTDFQAWFGLGQCHADDDIVVPDPASPSSWSFRGSYHTAIEAYTRALELVPSFSFAFGREAHRRLARVLYAESVKLRPGRAAPPDTTRFSAYPTLQDTLAFVPYVHWAVQAGNTPSRRVNEAVDRNRRILQAIAESWVDAFPDSARPHAVLAVARELNLAIGPALESARRSQTLANNATDSLFATAVEIRLLVKNGAFAAAQSLASRELGRWSNPDTAIARMLLPLAALIGQVHRAVQMAVALAPQTMEDVAPGTVGRQALPVFEASEALFIYAATGAPIDSVVTIAARLDTLVSVLLTAEQAEQVSCRIVWGPLALAYPVTRLSTNREACRDRDPRLEMEWALSRSDTQRVRVAMDGLEASWSGLLRPGDLAIDGVYVLAWLLAEVGDSARAAAMIDRSLAALRAMRTHVTIWPWEAAGLVRAMAFRAELAARRGDGRVARQWADAVFALWRDADPEVKEQLEQLRRLVE